MARADLTPWSYRSLHNSFHERSSRESAIPEEDVAAAIAVFLKHPDIGSGRAYWTLIDKEEAWISTGALNTVKQLLAELAAEEYKEREEANKLIEAQLRTDLAARRGDDYLHFRAEHPNHVWAVDFVNITFQGIKFALCVIFDEFTQNYPAIRVGMGADHELAVETFQEALKESGTRPEYLRRDNGKPFITEQFQEQLQLIEDYPVPPGSPWFNGGLESSNGPLKTAVKTLGMQDMAVDPAFFREIRKHRDLAMETLQGIVDRVQAVVNKEIARIRHRMPPEKVLSGQKQATNARHREFINRKREERTRRMAAIRANPQTGSRRPKTLIDKVHVIAKRMLKNMETNAVFVLDEALHQRFAMFET